MVCYEMHSKNVSTKFFLTEETAKWSGICHRSSYSVLTLTETETDTDTKTETDKMVTEPNGIN